jgi:polyhydroxybutyrate depolymerase
MPPIRFAAVFALLFGAAIAITSRAAEPERMTWNVDGIKREALVYPPAPSPTSQTAPLVFVFHGHGGNPRNISRSMHLQDIWPEAIVVYPAGLPTVTKIDPKGEKPGWQRAPGDNGDRDLKFFDAMLTSLRKKFTVDDHRIYATGFSNGSLFTFLLMSQRPKEIAAFAACAGPPSGGATLSTPKPVFIIAGEKDPIVPITLQHASIDRARKLNGTGEPSQGKVDGLTLYKSDKGTPVQTLVHSGGHQIPTEAPKLIVEFFQNHALKN